MGLIGLRLAPVPFAKLTAIPALLLTVALPRAHRQNQEPGERERPPQVAGLSGLRYRHRGPPAARPEHGPGRLHPGRGPEEVHQREGEHQLPVLQRGTGGARVVVVRFFSVLLFQDLNLTLSSPALRFIRFRPSQYFVFDFHMPPVMLFDKIITLSVSSGSLNWFV